MPASRVQINVANGNCAFLSANKPQKVLFACLWQSVGLEFGIYSGTPAVEFVGLSEQNFSLFTHHQFPYFLSLWDTRQLCIFEDEKILLNLLPRFKPMLLHIISFSHIQPSFSIAVLLLLLRIVLTLS